MVAAAIITILLIIRSNRRFSRRRKEEKGDTLFNTILTTNDPAEAWRLTTVFIDREQQQMLTFIADTFEGITEGFANDNVKALSRADKLLRNQKHTYKQSLRKETLCLRKASRPLALEKSAWFHLSNSCCMSMLYNVRRITEICLEHVDNNFRPLPREYHGEYFSLIGRTLIMLHDTTAMLSTGDISTVQMMRREGDEIKQAISDTYHRLYEHLREGDPSTMTVVYVYLNLLQETRELVSSLRKYLRAHAKLHDTEFSGQTRIIGASRPANPEAVPPHSQA